MPPGAISSVRIARIYFLSNVHLARRKLRQTIRIDDILVDEEAAPTSFESVEMLPVEGNARADNLHVSRAIMPQRLAGTVRTAVLGLQHHLLFEKKIHQLCVGCKLEAHRPDYLLEKIAQCGLP